MTTANPKDRSAQPRAAGPYVVDPLFGEAGRGLTGVESRALRAACGLDRRHISAIANIREDADVEFTTHDRVAQWERSKGRGYPAGVVESLNAIDGAIERLADELTIDGVHGSAVGTLHVPRPTSADSARRAVFGAEIFTAAIVAQVEADGQDIWHVLYDQAVVRAALRARGWARRTVIDMVKDGATLGADQP